MKKISNKTNDMSSKKNLEIEDPLDDEDISANSPPHKPPQKEVTMSLTKEKRFFFQKKTRDTSPSTTVRKSS